MTFNSIKENDVVILRIVKSKDPKFEHQAYIYYVCIPRTLNINKIYDGCYLGLCPFPHQIELSVSTFSKKSIIVFNFFISLYTFKVIVSSINI